MDGKGDFQPFSQRIIFGIYPTETVEIYKLLFQIPG